MTIRRSIARAGLPLLGLSALAAAAMAQVAPEIVVEGAREGEARSYPLGDVDGVRLMLPLDLDVRVGPRASLTIVAEDRAHRRIRVETREGVLELGSQGSLRTDKPMTGVLTLPRLSLAAIHGSGDMTVRGLSTRDFTARVHGSGDIAVEGRAERVLARIHGSGDIDLDALAIDSLDAAVHGSGDITVGRTRRLAAAIHGSGDVVYAGDPAITSRAIHGSGGVRRGTR